MKETLPFEPHEASREPTLAERAFRAKLRLELSRLRQVYERAHAFGPSMSLQEEYSGLRHWFHCHSADIKAVLTGRDEPRNGIATWTLEGKSADRLFRLIIPWSLNVDSSSEPSTWRRALADLIREAGGRTGKTKGCAPSRPKKSPDALLLGTRPVLPDLS